MPRTVAQAVGFLLGFWLALWLSPFRAGGEPRIAAPSHAALEDAFHREVNGVRAQRHLIPLQRQPALDAVARAHSADMARRGYFAHESPEGANPLDRLQRAQLDGFSLAAENIGMTTRSDPNREILNGWLQSASHRDNLYAPPFNATGIGIARAASGAWIYTQIYVTYPRRADAAAPPAQPPQR
ncbi:MAG: CAP domain-containing protein [Myxococcales bacterium]|nr:CAP domain-containing protein [Myxococcales bacterium]MDH5565825.1 CAP domain-containing protein [Myxococcales bacterium]